MKIRDFYTAVAANENNTAEVREHAQNELAKMDAANEKRRNTPSKAAQANAVLCKELLAKLKPNTVYTSAQVGELMEVNTSKGSVLLRDLVKANSMVEVEPVKGKSGKVKAYMLVSQ